MDLKYVFSGIGFVFLVLLDYVFFFGGRWFYSVLIMSFVIAGLPIFWLFLRESKRQLGIEEEFLEFSRALVENVRSGIPISQAILHMKNRDFGSLSVYTRKLANQISLGIPIGDALNVFARDSRNKTIKRSVAIIIQAEESGGYMEDVLSSVVESVINIKKLKEERKNSVYGQIVQGYVVFFIFIAVMLILEVKLMPMIKNMVGGMGGGLSGMGLLGEGDVKIDINFKRIFLSLILIQGLFTGLMIGKFSEGNVRYGIKHSFLLMVISLLIIFIVSPP